MQKQAPSPGRLATMVLFALSCFGLLLFLWTAFGGPTPLAPQGYRFKAAFDEAVQLADQAEVRISGVPVGKVVALEEAPDGSTLATMQLDEEQAPLPSDARVILRAKTLLGETFVELTPGSPDARPLPEDGRLPDAQVRPTVELDEVLRAFDPSTRERLQDSLAGLARSVEGRDADLNAALGNAAPVAEQGASLLAILDAQREAVGRGVRDTGRVFAALGRRESAVRTVVRASERVLGTTARRSERLREALRILPTFTAELRATLPEAEGAARDAAPVVEALAPVAPLAPPALRRLVAISPDLRRLFTELDPVITLSRTALPAVERTVEAARPLVAQLRPALADLNPVADYLGAYRAEVTQSWMNVAAATQAAQTPPGGTEPVHYLRFLAPFTAEAFVQEDERLPSNRHNPYLAPLGLEKLATGLLESFSCANTDNPQDVPVLGSAPAACKVQGPLDVPGGGTAYPHLRRSAP